MKKTLAALALALCTSAFAGPSVTVKGSDTMVILVQRWAEEFMKQNKALKIQVSGGGSGTGLAALQNGMTEIAASSRKIKKSEDDKLSARFKTPATEIAVAKDGVAFYVNEKNPLNALTMEQLKGIYLGDITNWKEVGGPDVKISLLSRENSSGTYVFVKEMLLNEEDFAAQAQTLPGTAAVVNAVAKDVNAIGYGGGAYAKGVKELKVKVGNEEIAPSAENVKSGKYPLSRDLYFYLRGKPQGDAKTFIDFALSPEGQQIVTKVGYYPVK